MIPPAIRFSRLATATTSVVPLSATVQDIAAVGGDPNAGDIRNTTVTFLLSKNPG